MANQTITVDTLRYSVYKIENLLNGKAYIGITSQKVHRRWNAHCSEKCSTMTPIKAAILKYGKENFEFSVIEKFDNPEDMKEAEQGYIDFFNTLSPNGYNLKTGGEFPVMTEEAKANMSKARIERFDRIGRKTPEEKHQWDVEYRRKNGIRSRKDSWNNQKRLDDARKRMTGNAYAVGSKGRPVKVILDGEFEFSSQKDLAEYLGVSTGGLNKCIKKGWKVLGHRVEVAS